VRSGELKEKAREGGFSEQNSEARAKRKKILQNQLSFRASIVQSEVQLEFRPWR